MVTHKLKVVYEFKVDDEGKAIREAQEVQLAGQFVHSGEDPEFIADIGQALEFVYDLDQGGDGDRFEHIKIVNRIFYNETVV
jgi:hypothetical protein